MVCGIGRASGPDGVVCGNPGRLLVCIGRAAWSPGPEASAVVQAQANTNLCRHVSGVPLAVMAGVAPEREWFQSTYEGKVGVVARVCGDEQLIAADRNPKNRAKATAMAAESNACSRRRVSVWLQGTVKPKSDRHGVFL